MIKNQKSKSLNKNIKNSSIGISGVSTLSISSSNKKIQPKSRAFTNSNHKIKIYQLKKKLDTK